MWDPPLLNSSLMLTQAPSEEAASSSRLSEEWLSVPLIFEEGRISQKLEPLSSLLVD